MRRIIMLFQAAAIVAVVMAMSAAPAMAQIQFGPNSFRLQEGPVTLGAANSALGALGIPSGPGQSFVVSAGPSAGIIGQNASGPQFVDVGGGGTGVGFTNPGGVTFSGF